MSLKKLLIALLVAIALLAGTVTLRSSLERTAFVRPSMVAVAKGVESGAVVGTFFLLCFVIAQGVHLVRARRHRRKVG